jgi:tetratricopeptide (TPR) repeat protein
MRRHLALLLMAMLLTGPVLCDAAAADTAAQESAARLDRLFTALRTAPDEQAAGQIETRIRQIWAEQATPATALLMTRGQRDLSSDAAAAVADFDAALDLQPDYAAGYTARAVARAATGDMAGAVRDVETALHYDLRHFTALQALSRIAEQQNNWKGALAAWRKLLEIDPRTPGGQERLTKLKRRAEGEAT